MIFLYPSSSFLLLSHPTEVHFFIEEIKVGGSESTSVDKIQLYASSRLLLLKALKGAIPISETRSEMDEVGK